LDEVGDDDDDGGELGCCPAVHRSSAGWCAMQCLWLLWLSVAVSVALDVAGNFMTLTGHEHEVAVFSSFVFWLSTMTMTDFMFPACMF